jgi:isoleucyl-tRNA synthetase
VQDFRKESELDIADRILVTYEASPKLVKAIEKNRDFIMAEILAVKMEKGTVTEGHSCFRDEFEHEKVAVNLIRAPKS